MMKTILLFILMGTIYQNDSAILFDASNANELKNWYVVDDGVMGGVSQGNLKLNDQGAAQFYGTVRLENNGGFSSVRHSFDSKDVSSFTSVVLVVKGDGKPYQFRIKRDADQRYSYINSFTTSGDWETIKLPFDGFYPGFRGNTLNKPNYSGDSMEEIAILIGNKRKEEFSLEISKIYIE